MAELDVLAGEIVSWAGHLGAGTAAWLGLIARFDQLEGFARWECQSTGQWLNWQCGLDLRSAREHVRVARRLEELPLIRETFSRGELSYSKVRAITRVATVDSEEDLVMLATHGTAAHVEKIVAALRRVTEHAALEVAEMVYDRRELTWHHDEDGTLILHARLSAEDGAVVRRAIDHALDTQPEPDQVEHRARSADALVSVAGAYLDGMANSSAQERYQVVVHVDAAVLTGHAENGDGRCHLDGGPAIPAETARRVACDTTVVTVIDGPDGPVAGGAGPGPSPPRCDACCTPGTKGAASGPAAGTAARTCTTSSIGPRGGSTDAENLVTLCSFHHRRVHEATGALNVTGTTQPPSPAPMVGPPANRWPCAVPLHLHHALTPTVTPNGITGRWAGEPLDLDHICTALTNTTPPAP